MIDSGEATVFVGGKESTTLKSGDYFGEIALIDEGSCWSVTRRQMRREMCRTMAA